MTTLPRHVLCILGNWKDLSDVRGILAERFPAFTLDEEFSSLTCDPRMPMSFDVSVRPGAALLDADDRASIAAHTAVAYVLSPQLEPSTSERIAAETLHLVATVLDEGGVAAKNESAGLAHGQRTWRRLHEAYAAATRAGDSHAAGAVLYNTWVQRPLVDPESATQYSIGMHLLGHPDTEVEATLEIDAACDWLDLMGLYLVADKPQRPILDGAGFRLSQTGPRRIVRKRPCSRYEPDSFMHNPFGYNRLVGETRG